MRFKQTGATAKRTADPSVCLYFRWVLTFPPLHVSVLLGAWVDRKEEPDSRVRVRARSSRPPANPVRTPQRASTTALCACAQAPAGLRSSLCACAHASADLHDSAGPAAALCACAHAAASLRSALCACAHVSADLHVAGLHVACRPRPCASLACAACRGFLPATCSGFFRTLQVRTVSDYLDLFNEKNRSSRKIIQSTG